MKITIYLMTLPFFIFFKNINHLNGMVKGLVQFKLGLKNAGRLIEDVIEGSLQVWENNIFKGKIRNNEEFAVVGC